ncbi:35329_t:CDS:2, partial [Racocetra persica]
MKIIDLEVDNYENEDRIRNDKKKRINNGTFKNGAVRIKNGAIPVKTKVGPVYERSSEMRNRIRKPEYCRKDETGSEKSAEDGRK